MSPPGMNQRLLQLQLCVSTKTTPGPALSPARALPGGFGVSGTQSRAGAAEPSRTPQNRAQSSFPASFPGP